MKPILIKPLTEMVQKTWSVPMSSNFYNCIIINSLHLQIFPSTVLGNPCWSFTGIGSTCFELNNFRLHFSLSTVVWTVWWHFLTTLAYLRSSIELLRSDHLWKNLQQSCIFNSPWGCAASEFMVCATVVDQAIYIPLERHKARLVCTTFLSRVNSYLWSRSYK